MTYNNENGTIRPRTFSNMELGCLYCPHLTPAMASRRLKEWIIYNRKHSKKCTFYTLRFGCSFAAVNTIKPQLL